MMAGNESIITVDDLTEKEPHLSEIQSVFKLPPHITSINPNAFKPNVVSFGPYHYNEPHLKLLEDLKLKSLNRFLKMSNNYKTLEHLLQSFEPMKQQLMEHYQQLGNEWTGGDCFSRLMIRDGCFMLEILQSNFNADDPAFRKSVNSEIMRLNIKRDMLLIENQLPLLVLHKLIADNAGVLKKLKDENGEDWKQVEESRITKEEFIDKQIHHLIMFFFGLWPMNVESHNVLCLHALDVFREQMIQRSILRPQPTTGTYRPHARPATVLHNTGVTFKSNNMTSYMDITFEEGVLTFPSIPIHKETKSNFLNLMAFEKFQHRKGQEVSAYIDFMNKLIHSAKDVCLLRKNGIITSERESDEEIAALFNELAESQIANPGDSLDELRLRLQWHYRENRRSWKTKLTKCRSVFKKWGHDFGDTYCKTPWAFIGLIAGFIILLLTAMQTFYSGAPFYKN